MPGRKKEIMIINDSKKGNSNQLELLRQKSINLSSDEVNKIFNDSYKVIAENLNNTNKNAIMPLTVDQTDNGIKIFQELAKSYYGNFNDEDLKASAEKSFLQFNKTVPDWATSLKLLKKSKKDKLAKEIYEFSSRGTYYSNGTYIRRLCKDFFEVKESNQGLILIDRNLMEKSWSTSLIDHLNKKSIDLLEIISFLANGSFELIQLPIYYSFSEDSLSLTKKDDGFIVTELKLSRDFGSDTILLKKLLDEDLNHLEEITKIISSALQRKYLHLSKNKPSFKGVIEGKFPAAILDDNSISASLRTLDLIEINSIFQSIPKSEHERWMRIIESVVQSTN